MLEHKIKSFFREKSVVASLGLAGALGFSTVFSLASCEQEQGQSQSISISPDQLGSVSGEVYLNILENIIPYSAIKQGKRIHCLATNSSYSVECTIRFASFDIVVRYSNSNSQYSKIKDACDSNPLCQLGGEDTVDFDGTYSLSNLLVGTYGVNLELGEGVHAIDYECWTTYSDDEKKAAEYNDIYLSIQGGINFTQTVGHETIADITIPADLIFKIDSSWHTFGQPKCEVID